MGGVTMVSQGEVFTTPNLHARAVAVVPGLRRVDRNFILPIKFTDSLQSFPQDCAFHFQLNGISGVLVVAAATLPKIRARGFGSYLRRLQELIERGPRIACFFIKDGHADLLAGKDKGNKDSLALGAAS